MQLQELNDCFTKANAELLICMEGLVPDNDFSSFDKKKLIRFAELYPSEFSSVDLMALDNQFDTYILDMHSNNEFAELKGIASFAAELVKTKRDIVYPLVYLLIKLALTLPVALATMEMTFLAIKIVKNGLRNRMGDQWMNDCLITCIEKDILNKIDNELILQRFQKMSTRRGQL
ncbi:uncharacterized protein [Coffea arabica]|uniref:HAT C-terminal dimerisation domain-containing protein n=1 Tax=Coffea arabica TaxID=13443 RepID=A0ABM4W0V8_COFAR